MRNSCLQYWTILSSTRLSSEQCRSLYPLYSTCPCLLAQFTSTLPWVFFKWHIYSPKS